jgi:hypothetical protein
MIQSLRMLKYVADYIIWREKVCKFQVHNRLKVTTYNYIYVAFITGTVRFWKIEAVHFDIKCKFRFYIILQSSKPEI